MSRSGLSNRGHRTGSDREALAVRVQWPWRVRPHLGVPVLSRAHAQHEDLGAPFTGSLSWRSHRASAFMSCQPPGHVPA